MTCCVYDGVKDATEYLAKEFMYLLWGFVSKVQTQNIMWKVTFSLGTFCTTEKKHDKALGAITVLPFVSNWGHIPTYIYFLSSRTFAFHFFDKNTLIHVIFTNLYYPQNAWHSINNVNIGFYIKILSRVRNNLVNQTYYGIIIGYKRYPQVK